MGVGGTRDNVAPSTFQVATRLMWIDTAGAIMLDVEPASASAVSLYAADVRVLVLDCAGLANVCLKLAQTSASVTDVDTAEPRLIGAWFTTTTTTDEPGLQTDARPTCGYRRITALLNRARRAAGAEPLNHKRVFRLMRQGQLLLQPHVGLRPTRTHEGSVVAPTSNQRWS